MMKRSTDRILTTHVGSLPRPDDLFELMLARMDGKPIDETPYAAQRLDGLEKREGTRPSPFSNTRETRDFPEYYQSAVADQVSARRRRALMVCTGGIKYKGHDALKFDLDALKSA